MKTLFDGFKMFITLIGLSLAIFLLFGGFVIAPILLFAPYKDTIFSNYNLLSQMTIRFVCLIWVSLSCGIATRS